VTNIEGIKVVHAIPGRLRLKISRMRRNPALVAEVQKRFSSVQAIRQVVTNPLTGSVLLLYDLKEIFLPGSLGLLLEALSSLFPEFAPEDIRDWLDSLSREFGSQGSLH
jgi:hypothetical protein